MNYKKQVINWIRDLFASLHKTIENTTGVKTEDFIQFYECLNQLKHNNFRGYSIDKKLLRLNWKDYTKIQMRVVDNAFDFIKEMDKQREYLYYFTADHGIKD